MNFGLVCLTSSTEIRYKTITRKKYVSLSDKEKFNSLLSIYTANVNKLHEAINYCIDVDIYSYRVPSHLFPFLEDEIGSKIFDSLFSRLQLIGNLALSSGIRLTTHPDQFVVLSSDKPDVVENSINELNLHAKVLNALNQPKTPYACINIHGGKSDRVSQLAKVIVSLDEDVKSRLTLENDEYAYECSDILDVCERAGVSFVYDCHHHLVNKKLKSYDDPEVAKWVKLAGNTWNVKKEQLVHLSNGASDLHDRRHSDYIVSVPESYYDLEWIDVEAKAKEQAIFKLQ